MFFCCYEGLLIFCMEKDNIVWNKNLLRKEEDHFLKLLGFLQTKVKQIGHFKRTKLCNVICM